MLQWAIIRPECHTHPEMECFRTGLMLGCCNGWNLAKVCLITHMPSSSDSPLPSSILNHAPADQLILCKKFGLGVHHLTRQFRIQSKLLNLLNFSETNSRMHLRMIEPPSRCSWSNFSKVMVTPVQAASPMHNPTFILSFLLTGSTILTSV